MNVLFDFPIDDVLVFLIIALHQIDDVQLAFVRSSRRGGVNHVVSLELYHELLILSQEQLGQDLQLPDRLNYCDAVKLIKKLLLANFEVNMVPEVLRPSHGLLPPAEGSSEYVVEDRTITVVEDPSFPHAFLAFIKYLVLAVWIFFVFLNLA